LLYWSALCQILSRPESPPPLRKKLAAEPDKAVYFGLRDKIVPIPRGNPVLRWQLALFAFMFRNSVGASVLFRIPSHQYLEVGRQLEV
jgi:K+ transporter